MFAGRSRHRHHESSFRQRKRVNFSTFLNPVLTSDQKTSLNELLDNFGDIFTDKPGRTKATEIRIETEDVYPIHFPPYLLPMAKLPQLEAEVKQLLQGGVIRPSSSPWASAIVLVPKTDGSTRLTGG